MIDDEVNDDDLDESLREASAEEVPRERAERFYDRIRKSIHRYVERKGAAVEKTAQFLLLVPDVFILLWRLLNDARVNGKNKVLIGSSVVYFIFPLDILPEAFLGPMGFMDDLVFGVYVLNKILTDTTAEIVREHWSGQEDVLAMIQRVLNAADSLVGGNLVERIKRMVR
jgi:uncharacterized membrane protein YkvA (DUF1232 family)